MNHQPNPPKTCYVHYESIFHSKWNITFRFQCKSALNRSLKLKKQVSFNKKQNKKKKNPIKQNLTTTNKYLIHLMLSKIKKINSNQYCSSCSLFLSIHSFKLFILHISRFTVFFFLSFFLHTDFLSFLIFHSSHCTVLLRTIRRKTTQHRPPVFPTFPHYY